MRLAPDSDQQREERDRLVMDHVGLVKSMASRLARRLPAQVGVSELVSVGVLGLIDAAGRYRPSLGIPFSAFARRRIHGAMLDALREVDWAPRSVRRAQREVDAVISRLRHTTGHEPESHEIAAALNVSLDEYEKMLDQIRSIEVATVRLAGGREEGRGDLLDIAVDTEDSPHARVERQELRKMLARALAKLPERERQIIALSYVEELTLAEIGETIGVGESRVSQLRTQAIARLRTMMCEWMGQANAH